MLLFLLVGPTPDYPKASDWSPIVDWEADSPAELTLIKFLRQAVKSEVSELSNTYSGEFSFIAKAINSICRDFLESCNSQIMEKLNSSGAMKKREVGSFS